MAHPRSTLTAGPLNMFFILFQSGATGQHNHKHHNIMNTSQFTIADCILTAQHVAGYGIKLTATGSPEDLEQLEDYLVHFCPSIEQYLTDKCFRFGHVTLPESFDLHTIESFTEQQHIQEELLIQGSPEPIKTTRCCFCGHSDCTCGTQKSANIYNSISTK